MKNAGFFIPLFCLFIELKILSDIPKDCKSFVSNQILHIGVRRKVKYGIASACIGGGQGTAILFENILS
jgi:hypothetical protein